jgi:hypothetical protein
MEPIYVSPEQIMSALDVKPSAYMSGEVLRACESGSRATEGRLHRVFYPAVITRTFDWPRPGMGESGSRLYFDERQLISLTSISSGGTPLATGNVFLRPDSLGPPFEYIELDRNSSAAFSGGTQRAISITGLWGFRNEEVPAGALITGADLDPAATLITLTKPVDVGSILRLESERMMVTEKQWVTSGSTASVLGSSKSDLVITVTGGGVFTPGEELLLDGERLQVVDVAGAVLIVRRAVGGSVLAAHTAGTAIYWQHRFTCVRGALGTTAAYHGNAIAVSRVTYPSLATELSQAYAEDAFLQRNAGYARTAGTGDSERQVSGRALKPIEDRAYALLGRKVRVRAV